MTAEPDPELSATCATHTCPDGYEKELDDVVGDTDKVCCWKPLCIGYNSIVLQTKLLNLVDHVV